MSRFNLPGVLFLVMLAAVWEATARISASPNFPALSQVFYALFTNHAVIAAETAQTLKRASLGFLIALVTMLPLGILLGRVRILGQVVEPLIELIRPLPPIAIVPVALLFLGTGDEARVAVVAYGCAFPILINAIDAVRGAHPMLARVSRALRLTRLEQMWFIDLPAALPQIMAGVRISVAFAVLLAVVAEMLLSSNGLGTFIVRAQERFQIANGLAGILVIAVLALAINSVLRRVDQRLLAWHMARAGSGIAERRG
jgi:ABC-type nitrate/sulfonate/bicarbonate transport system permease component